MVGAAIGIGGGLPCSVVTAGVGTLACAAALGAPGGAIGRVAVVQAFPGGERELGVVREDGASVVEPGAASGVDGDRARVAATEGHPFVKVTSEGPVWVTAGELVAGDVVRTQGGGVAEVVKAAATTRNMTVYNLSVTGDHTYLVADPRGPPTGIAVHNVSCGCGSSSCRVKPSGGATPLNSHYNTRESTLYRLVDKDTREHLKWGISIHPKMRYSKTHLENENAVMLITDVVGNNRDIRYIERFLVAHDGGRLSQDPWSNENPTSTSRYREVVEEFPQNEHSIHRSAFHWHHNSWFDT